MQRHPAAPDDLGHLVQTESDLPRLLLAGGARMPEDQPGLLPEEVQGLEPIIARRVAFPVRPAEKRREQTHRARACGGSRGSGPAAGGSCLLAYHPARRRHGRPRQMKPLGPTHRQHGARPASSKYWQPHRGRGPKSMSGLQPCLERPKPVLVEPPVLRHPLATRQVYPSLTWVLLDCSCRARRRC